MPTEALVTPKLITWARERAGLDTDSASKKLGVRPTVLQSWEDGEEHPSLKQAENLANRFNIPFGYLYLSQEPIESLPLPDLRTVAGAPPGKPSPEFLDVLDDALTKQQWYREHLESLESEPLEFIGKFTIHDPVVVVAADIRHTLGLDNGLRNTASSWDQFLTQLVRATESLGILVLRNSIVGSNTHRPLSVEEFRGFVISDDLAPLIFINSRDAKTAQIFTLAHELAHLWAGQSGVSNPDYTAHSDEQHNEIERQANRIAAETLVPRDEFLIRWNDHASLDANLDSLVRWYRVSAFVILRSGFDYGKIDQDLYRDKLSELFNSQRPTGTGGGGNFYSNVLSRNSPTFTLTIVAAAAEGRVPYKEAANLLNVVNLGTLQKIEATLLQGG